MITAPVNNVIVLPETKYISNISSLVKLAALQNVTSVHAEDMVNIMGEVISVPKSLGDEIDLGGFTTDDIKVGDIAIFSFQVICDLMQREHEGELVYRNRLWYQDKEYFLAHIRNIYGVIRGEEIIMVNGYVMTESFPENVIYTPATQKKERGTVKAKVMHIGKPIKGNCQLGVKSGNDIYFNPMIAQKYQINNKSFCIIQQGQILGIAE